MILGDYINHAPAISAMYKACGGIWGSVSGSSEDLAKFDNMMATCRSTVMPLTDSNDTAMKTMVASVNTALDASDKAAKQIVPLDYDKDDVQAQEERRDDLSVKADPGFHVKDSIEQYGRDLRAERKALHLDWCIKRAYKTEDAQKDSAEDGAKARKAYLKGPGKADNAKNPEATAQAVGNVVQQWYLLDATVDALNIEGMGSLETVDLDDLSAVLQTVDSANQALSKQMETNGDNDNRAFNDYQSSYATDKALITQYATTILAVSNSQSACSYLPEQVSSDSNYTAYSGYVNTCSAALKPLANAKAKKTLALYSKMSANVGKSSEILTQLKALGSPSEGANGPHGKKYQQLRAQLDKNAGYKISEMFEDYNSDFQHTRSALAMVDVLNKLSGQSGDV
ncbi:hypothetical protein OZX67_04345 [Bifidobacterium sp. ESL0728]|uniref:hypothetical protein n=1 Tax=Bifidobacterium sp. ESL0728 TaxID=2983220 RepID=UPI0023F8154A|nr:hypothetical protein [Bifidobacterium sp. ESL0728]WEV59771.1 hypothetical protein OZX67_04345 [Bifidobacterium sp. ESL0728]